MRTANTILNECWSTDFVADQLFDGRKFRALTLVDNFSRKCLVIRVGQSIKGIDVVNIMEDVNDYHKTLPKRIQVDNGSEFISKDFDNGRMKIKWFLIIPDQANQQIILSLNLSTVACVTNA